MASSNDLPCFTIYERPSDFPDVFVVRQSTIMALAGGADVVPGPVLGTADSLECARRLVPGRAALTCFPRSPGDDPVIVECWI